MLPTPAVYTYYRLGLVTGLVDIPELIAWADAQVLASPAPAPELIELSLAGRQPYSQLIGMLYPLQGDKSDYQQALELLFGRARRLLDEQPDRAVEIAQGLRLLKAEAYLPGWANARVGKIEIELQRYRDGSQSQQQLSDRLEALLSLPFLNVSDDPQSDRLPTRLSRKTIYRNPWVNLFVDQVEFPSGLILDEHHLVDFERHAVMAAATDRAGHWLMVKVPRYPTGREEWEFPAGRIEDGEDPLEAARRELFEETGYRSSGHVLLYRYHPMVGISNMIHHIVRCQVEGPGGEYDRNEVSGVGWFSEAEIWQMIERREVMGGYTLISFLLACQLK